jgi:hypothetical protein
MKRKRQDKYAGYYARLDRSMSVKRQSRNMYKVVGWA